MKKVNIVLIWILVSFLLSACSDFFEKDMTGRKVELISPPDYYETSVMTITFTWDQELGATKYNLQVVQPGFDRIEHVVADTVTPANHYTVTLSPGTFQWRVYASNESSRTGDAPVRTLVVDSTLSLSNQPVVLLKPSNELNTNQTELLLQWNKISIANDYLVEVKRNSWTGEQAFGPVVTKNDTVSVQLEEGIYYWGVHARNENTNTDYTVRQFLIDTTAPGIPQLLLPAANDTIQESQVIFSWDHTTGSLSNIEDSLMIAGDSLFQDRIFDAVIKDSTRSLNISPSEYGITEGKYYWRLRAYDKAGNMSSGYSVTRSFYIEDEE